MWRVLFVSRFNSRRNQGMQLYLSSAKDVKYIPGEFEPHHPESSEHLPSNWPVIFGKIDIGSLNVYYILQMLTMCQVLTQASSQC